MGPWREDLQLRTYVLSVSQLWCAANFWTCSSLRRFTLTELGRNSPPSGTVNPMAGTHEVPLLEHFPGRHQCARNVISYVIRRFAI